MKWDAKKYDAAKAPQVDAGRELIAMANVGETDSILDLGCGTGRLTLELANLTIKGNVTGIDPSKEMLDETRKRCHSFKNISLKQLPAQSMKYSNEFDLVFSNSAVHWIREQRLIAGLAYNSLKDRGRIAFQMPARDFCTEFFEYAVNAIESLGLGEFYRNWETPWHLPSKDEYESTLRDAGFGNIKVYYRDYTLVFENINEILGWWCSAGLRPFLERLPEKEQEYFKYAFAMSFEKNRTEKGIEFNFRRLFAFAEK